MKTPLFATEADLCRAFAAWAARVYPDVRLYAEWAGWDILLVYLDGRQLGIQAKLRLNADVILQASPTSWKLDKPGPDFRGVLVPKQRDAMHAIADRLGLVVFWPSADSFGASFHPCIVPGSEWLDWNPRARHKLPPAPTDAIAGSPCPVTLTPWKLAALDVLAEIAVRGSITTKRMRELHVDPSRWLSACWLLPSDKRGDWIRGERCPRFDEQHPSTYTLALEKATASVQPWRGR